MRMRYFPPLVATGSVVGRTEVAIAPSNSHRDLGCVMQQRDRRRRQVVIDGAHQPSEELVDE